MFFSMVFTRVTRFTLASLIAASAFLASAAAGELDALKGKTIRVIIASSPGGTTDTTAREFIKFLKYNLPETTVRVQNVGGSGGAKAIKELQESDGSAITIAAFNYGPIYAQLISPEVAPYDLNRVHWIGSLSKVDKILAIRSGLGGRTIDALRKLDRQAVIPTSDKFSTSTIESLLINGMFQLRMKIVAGTSDEQQTAMLLAGQADAIVGSPFEFGPQLVAGELIPVLSFGSDTVSDLLRGTPAVADIVPPDVPDELVFLMETLDRSGRLIAAAPSTDPQVLGALRSAFDVTAANAEFIEAMAKLNVVVRPTSGAELSDRLAKVIGQNSGDLRKMVQFYLSCGQRISDTGADSCK